SFLLLLYLVSVDRLISPLFYSLIRPPSISTLFPYTTLFRSRQDLSAAKSCSLSHQGTHTSPSLYVQILLLLWRYNTVLSSKYFSASEAYSKKFILGSRQ